ncbi:borealin-2-like [Dendropsophus ebraccatus]|uniref:borealin-2-like n=1 Tax=Dendropsophus ebraccatus TaxID=150705 RepID=UPI003831C177
MPAKRTRKRLGARAQGSGDSGLGMVDPMQEQKNEKIRLFMQDFIQQKKEHMKEVKKELEVLAMLPDQIMEVEILKMPMSVRQMKVGEYYKLMEINKAESSLVPKADNLDEELQEAKLVRKNSRKVKVTTSVEYHDSITSTVKSTMQKNRTVQKVSKSKSLVSLTNDAAKKTPSLARSVSATPLNKASKKMTSVSSCRTVSRTLRNSAAPPTRSSRTRALSSLSDLPLHEGLPFVHIPLVDGQTLSSAYDDLESLDVELLRQDTVQHIHTLVGQLTNLCAKASTQHSAGGHG